MTAAGRPRRQNDPSVMSSLESAVREIRRPGPIESCWNWRWELGIVLTIAGLAGLIAASYGFTGLVAAAGAGLAASSALLCWPPARRRIVIPSVQHAHLVTLEVIRNSAPLAPDGQPGSRLSTVDEAAEAGSRSQGPFEMTDFEP